MKAVTYKSGRSKTEHESGVDAQVDINERVDVCINVDHEPGSFWSALKVFLKNMPWTSDHEEV